MTESAAAPPGIEERLSRLFPGMVWSAFPYRTASPVIPIDLEVAGNLFTLFPKWDGDWADFENALRKHGNFTTAELPNASIKNISSAAAAQLEENMERRAARGLVCSGASGTSVATLHTPAVIVPVGSPETAEDDETSTVVQQLKGTRRMQILLVLRAWPALEILIQ